MRMTPDRRVRIGHAPLPRRTFLRTAGALGAAAGLEALLPGYAWPRPAHTAPRALEPRMEGGAAVYELEIAESPIVVAGRRATATTTNGTVPGPQLHLYEGQDAVIRVTNRLGEDTSIHWHGLVLPPEMDGVPGISFPGIRPGETFEYRFPVRQHGTYWYHSHSGLQEQVGHYGPLIIRPADGDPYAFDREYTVVLSDWTFENPYRILARLKKQPDYYNFRKRTVFDFFRDVARDGLAAALGDRLIWAEMRMNPTDLSDVTGAAYTYLMNGLAPEDNWTGLFRPGERVLLRFINASAATYFDVRVPGLPMTVVQVSGQAVEPVETDELRIAIAETYDVIVEPGEDRAYTVFAEAMDRSGYARGTLAPREGMEAPVPERRERPVLSMADMGMDHGQAHGSGHGASQSTGHGASPGAGHGGASGARDAGRAAGAHAPSMAPADTAMSARAGHGAAAGASTTPAGAHAEHSAAGTGAASGAIAAGAHAGHGAPVPDAAATATHAAGPRPPGAVPGPIRHGPDTHGPGNAAVPAVVRSRLHEPGTGLGGDGWRVLTYADLRAPYPEPRRAPDREIELHLTANMERFTWSIDGVPFADAEPIRLAYGERIRLTMINDTMMNHPMHLHGMWMELENGHGERIPRVHTINVKPAERVSLLLTADAPGRWAFHCHVLYHMEVGMFRVVEVSAPRDADRGTGHDGAGHDGAGHTPPEHQHHESAERHHDDGAAQRGSTEERRHER
ncbi:MAG TPA: copper resistance system multicopper oxidase [Longimicrobiales bacterium]